MNGRPTGLFSFSTWYSPTDSHANAFITFVAGKEFSRALLEAEKLSPSTHGLEALKGLCKYALGDLNAAVNTVHEVWRSGPSTQYPLVGMALTLSALCHLRIGNRAKAMQFCHAIEAYGRYASHAVLLGPEDNVSRVAVEMFICIAHDILNGSRYDEEMDFMIQKQMFYFLGVST